MAVVRTLTTLFDFKTQDSGLKEYQSKVTGALGAIRKQVGFIGGMIGAELAISTIGNFVKGIANNVRAANKMGAQLAQAIDPGEDSTKVMDHLFSVAQDLGAEFVSVASTFKDMVSASKLFGVNTETTMAAFENISKAMEVNRLSEEDSAAAWSRINTAIGRGSLSARSIGELMQEAPRTVQLLADSLTKGSIPALQKMAADGDITTQKLVAGFARVNKMLDQDFAEKPNTLGEAFNYAYNEMVRAGRAIWKITYFSRGLADAIVSVTKTIVTFSETFIESIGGVENAINLVKYAFLTTFGYYTISLMMNVIKYLRVMTLQAVLLNLKFAAIVAVIAAIALAIDDIVAWTQGRKSVLGGLIGRKEEWQPQIDAFMQGIGRIKGIFTDAFTNIGKLDLTSIEGLRGLVMEIRNIFKELGTVAMDAIADITKGTMFEPLVTSFRNILPTVQLLTDSFTKFLMLDFKGASASWNEAIGSISWEGIKTGIESVSTSLKNMEAAAMAALKELFKGTIIESIITTIQQLQSVINPLIESIWKFATGDTAGALQSLQTAFDAVKQIIFDLAAKFSEMINLTNLWNVAVQAVQDIFNLINGMTFGALKTSLDAVAKVLDGMATAAKWVGGLLGFKAKEPTESGTPTPGVQTTTPSIVATEQSDKDRTLAAPVATPEQSESFWGSIMRYAPTWLGGGNDSSVVPTVAPGEIAGAGMTPIENNTQNNSVPITNNVNVNVTADFQGLEARVKAQVDSATNRMAEDTAKQLTRSMPRMEMATGQ